jgi:hypothetical protein
MQPQAYSHGFNRPILLLNPMCRGSSRRSGPSALQCRTVVTLEDYLPGLARHGELTVNILSLRQAIAAASRLTCHSCLGKGRQNHPGLTRRTRWSLLSERVGLPGASTRDDQSVTATTWPNSKKRWLEHILALASLIGSTRRTSKSGHSPNRQKRDLVVTYLQLCLN